MQENKFEKFNSIPRTKKPIVKVCKRGDRAQQQHVFKKKKNQTW